ncbi:MAG: FAD:protein FMN transferase [Planctomycetes bacterium]|nr:FAD:protein FMN transferase [Planctomycetota bacterium]
MTRCLLPLLALSLLTVAQGQEPRPAPAKRPLEHRVHTGSVMGTSLKIEAFGPDGKALEEAIAAAVAEIKRVEDVFTTWRPSPLNRLNDAAGKGPHPMTKEELRLIGRSLEIGRLTEGAFDVTFAGVGKLWNFKKTPPKVPTKDEIKVALARVDYRKVQLDLEAGKATLPKGMRIGLGGIAKGYGVDRAMAVLMKRGIRHAVVNAGGDLKALGKKRGKAWEIAIKHPRDRERVIAVLPVSNVCVVTSGDYERFYLHEGKRYHHILDPRTGYPSTGCMSATVTAPDAAFADALATAMCVLGPKKGLEILEGLPRVEGILIDLDGKIVVTSGLRRRGVGGE